MPALTGADVLDEVLATLAEFPEGARVPDLAAAAGRLTDIQIRNALSRGKSRGLIMSPRRGVYQLTKKIGRKNDC